LIAEVKKFYNTGQMEITTQRHKIVFETIFKVTNALAYYSAAELTSSRKL
jgi:hypothetical protein